MRSVAGVSGVGQTSRVELRVTTAAGLRDRLNANDFEEPHYVEAKREIPSGQAANRELARDIASFGVHGGWFVVGVAEDKEHRRFEPTPQALSGLAE